MMQIHEDEISQFVNALWRNQIRSDDDKFKEMEEFYDKIVIECLKPRDRNTHIALSHCKSYEEIADEFTKREMKKKPIKPDSIRKRRDRILKIIKEKMTEKYDK